MRPGSWLLPIAFAAFGVMWGVWQSVLPDLARHHGLTSGPLGTILTLGFAVALPAMLLTGRLVDRLGAGWGMAITATSMAAGMLLVATLAPLGALVLGVILMAAGSGAYDVAINGAAMGDEAWSRPACLTLLHAAFSGGGMAGAIGAGLEIGAGVTFQLVYAPPAAVLLVTALLAARSGWHAPPPKGRVPRAVALAMLPLAMIAALAFVAEGSMETWSAIYLRDELGTAALSAPSVPLPFTPQTEQVDLPREVAPVSG